MPEWRRLGQVKRPSEEAKRLREQANLLPPRALKAILLRKARPAESGTRLSERLRPSGPKRLN
jgi:hypothetical protein